DARNPAARLALLRQRIAQLQAALMRGARRQQTDSRARVREAGRALHALSPLRTLDRGYAILRDPRAGAVLNTTVRVRAAGSVTARLADGDIRLDVVPDPE